MQAMIGFLALGAMIWYPWYAYQLHIAGHAEPWTYIILGMFVMLWLNVAAYFLKRGDD